MHTMPKSGYAVDTPCDSKGVLYGSKVTRLLTLNSFNKTMVMLYMITHMKLLI